MPIGNFTRIFYENTGEHITNIIPYLNSIFIFLILPVILILILFLALKYKTEIKVYLDKHNAKKGRIKIKEIQANKHIKNKYIKLDEYNNFSIGKRKYNITEIEKYIIGYENTIPTFLVYQNLIVPLLVDNISISKEIETAFNLDKEKDKIDFRAVILKINPQTLDLVYTRKLLSDLYSISKSPNEFLQKYFIYILIGGGVLLMWYLGYLDDILCQILGIACEVK